MVKLSILFLTALLVILMPDKSFAWGPGVHIGVSLSVLDRLPDYLRLLLMGNINEFLYGSLAPDFILGKTLSEEKKHSHNWSVAFKILDNAETDREKAFAYGYISHLAADAVAHGMLVNSMDKRFKGARHAYLEIVADNHCPATYKQLAKEVLKKYNRNLDENFKDLVDSVLFSFGVSKLLFKGMVKISLGRKNIKRIVFNPKISEIFSINENELEDYIELSRQFCLSALIEGKGSPVVKISAISK